MLANPFSPIFGGRPEVFFGRDKILNLFDLAMTDTGSDDRALFITGTRGSGKTALLEQLSIRANQKKKKVIDLGPESTVEQLIYELAGYDEKTSTASPQANINVLGVGAGVSAGAVSKTKQMGRKNMPSLLLEVCKKSKNGIFVTIDEAQKVPIEDMSSICNAFQMASRKGYDIMLAVASLPYAYTDITQHEGCTYLRRASHEELGLFSWEEASDALNTVFSRIEGINIAPPLLEKINLASFGHPYIMQLLGYHLVLQINQNNPKRKHKVLESEVQGAIKNALLTYEQRALKPLMDELPENEKKYLIKMSEYLDEERLAQTSDIAQGLGVSQNKLSRARAYLIDQGIIAAPEHGKVMFCIPYLADFVKKEASIGSVIEVARARRV